MIKTIGWIILCALVLITPVKGMEIEGMCLDNFTIISELNDQNELLTQCQTSLILQDNSVSSVREVLNNIIVYEEIKKENNLKLQYWYDRFQEYSYATYIWLYLKDWGFSDAAIAGIIGNMMMETSYNSLALNPFVGGYDYYGLCQWSLYYAPSIKGACLDEQLSYLIQTMPNEFANFGFLSGYTFEDFVTIDNAETAAWIFAVVYERCLPYSYYMRQSNALIAYNYFVG